MMKNFNRRVNRATYATIMLFFLSCTSVAVAFKIRIPGEVLLVYLCVPRLHDIGRSGWWMLLPIIFEIAAVVSTMLLGTKMGLDEATSLGLATLACLVALFVPAVALLFVPGQRAPNSFGDAPAPGIHWRSLWASTQPGSKSEIAAASMAPPADRGA